MLSGVVECYRYADTLHSKVTQQGLLIVHSFCLIELMAIIFFSLKQLQNSETFRFRVLLHLFIQLECSQDLFSILALVVHLILVLFVHNICKLFNRADRNCLFFCIKATVKFR